MALRPAVRDPEDNGQSSSTVGDALIFIVVLEFCRLAAIPLFSPKNARPSKVPTFGAQPLLCRLFSDS